MFTESSRATLEQQAASDCEFHQLDETHHHLWYSSWHWSHHPNTVRNTDITADCHHLIQLLQTHMHVIMISVWNRKNYGCGHFGGVFFIIKPISLQTDRETERQTDRQTDRQTERETDRDKQTDRQTDWQTDRWNCHANCQTWSSNIRLKPLSRHIKTWTFHLTTIYVFIFTFMLYIHITSKIQ